MLEEVHDSISDLIAHSGFLDVGVAEGMVTKSVHARPAGASDYIVFWPKFQP